MTSTNNLKSIVTYLKNEDIEIDFDEFQFQVESHPDYPSLLSFSDALSFFNIKNLSTKIPFHQLELLPDSYIALLNNDLAFVQNTQKGFIKNDLPISNEKLKAEWKEIVLIIQKNEDIIKNKNKKIGFEIYLLLALSISAFVTLLIVFNAFWLIYFFLVISVIGLVVSIETFKQTLGIKSGISTMFCNSLPNNDCNSVINSSKWIFLKSVSLSDVCIIFFACQLISLFTMSLLGITSSFLILMKYGLWLTIPISFLSIYYQRQVEKKWCPLCLTVIAVLYVQLISVNLFYYCSQCNISLTGLLIFVSITLAAIAMWLFLKPLFLKNKELKETEIKNLKFRRNYDLFKLSLKAQTQLIDFDTTDAIVLGNPKANFKIYIITSPFCGYCEEVHKILNRILLKFYEQVVVYLRFNSNPNYSAKETDIIYRNLIRIYQEEGQNNFINALNNWYVYKERDREVWKKQFARKVDIIETDKILNNQWNWVVKNNLNFTPAIVVQKYLYPSIYNRNDLEFFIPDLAEDNLE